MEITKYTHSCVRLETTTGAVTIDPGGFSGAAELEEALSGVRAVLVTHEHPDHLDVESLSLALRERADVHVWGTPPVRDLLAEHPDRVTVVGAGESFEAGGLAVTTHGGQHALIHSGVPVVPNVAYLVQGSVLHPGDSFTVPPEPVHTLLLPLHAPWSKVGEVLDHVVAVRAATVHAIHDGLLNDRGRSMVETHINRVANAYGSDYAPLQVGETASS